MPGRTHWKLCFLITDSSELVLYEFFWTFKISIMGEVCYLVGGSMECRGTHVNLQGCGPEVHCHSWLPSWSSYSMPSSLVRMSALDRSWGMNCVVAVAVGVTEGQGGVKLGKRLLALREAKKKRKKKETMQSDQV